MKFIPKNSVKKFQAGGPVEQDAPMPEETVPAGGEPEVTEEQNPLIALAEGAMQALQSGDCQMAMQVCQGLVEIAQQAAAPEPQAPQGEPVFKKGGILLRRIKK